MNREKLNKVLVSYINALFDCFYCLYYRLRAYVTGFNLQVFQLGLVIIYKT